MDVLEFGTLTADTVLLQPVDEYDLKSIENEIAVIRENTAEDFRLIAFKVKAIVAGNLKDAFDKKFYGWSEDLATSVMRRIGCGFPVPDGATLGNETGIEYGSGCITEDRKHHVEKCFTHYNPCGVNVRQAVVIEMKNIVNRLSIYMKGWKITSELVTTLNDILDHIEEPVKVVNKDSSSEGLEDKQSIAKLNTSGESEEPYGWMKASKELQQNKPEDTIGETLAREIGNKNYKPEKGNDIDEELKDTEVYVVKKNSFVGNIIKSLSGMFGEGKDKKQLQQVFEESFKTEENDEENDEGEE